MVYGKHDINTFISPQSFRSRSVGAGGKRGWAHHKSKRDVEQLLARLRPQPDVTAVVRKLPAPRQTITPQRTLSAEEREEDGYRPPATDLPVRPTRPPEVKPLAPERYKVQFTVSRETYERLRQVQDLLRHTIPSGDPAAIFDRALTLLLALVSKTKLGATNRPRPGREARPDSRHIPAAVKREVWRRHGGRCAFRGAQGRCRETGFLEFHHVVPYADGGATTCGNLEVRCRAHNVYEAERHVAQQAQRFLIRDARGFWHGTVNSVQT